MVLSALLMSRVAVADLQPLRYIEQPLKLPDQIVQVRIPEGYELQLLTADLQQPRLLSFSEHELFIGSKSGAIYRLQPPYREPETVLNLDSYPHSVVRRGDELLIAQTDGLYRIAYQPGQSEFSADDVTLLAPLPAGSGHNSRTVAVGPDGRIYLSLGITGNCSDEYLGDEYAFQDRRGGILVLDEGTAQNTGKAHWRTFASGLRNPVGFAWHPSTGELYASNNGPDHWGFELPPEYFSRVRAGSFHGMPWFQFDGKALRRDSCIDRDPPRPQAEVTLPVVTFPARNAPMGVTFVPEQALHSALAQDAIVALRGSWGTQPSGGFIGDPATRREPKLVAVRFKAGVAQRVDDLVTGFQAANGKRWARPVGVAIGPDGALYFTSDSGINGLFRLAPRKQSSATD